MAQNLISEAEGKPKIPPSSSLSSSPRFLSYPNGTQNPQIRQSTLKSTIFFIQEEEEEDSVMPPQLLLYQPNLHHPTHHSPQPKSPNIASSNRICSVAFLNSPSPAGLFLRPAVKKLQRRDFRVVNMANPRRVKMVAKQIQRELSDMLLTDTVLQYAVLPEAALGADRYLSSLTTISDVEVTADLQVVKVYVSVFGDERGKEVAIAGLKSKAKYVRGQLGKRMKLRLTPEIRFIEDDSIERGNRVIAILDKIKDEKKVVGTEDDKQAESSDLPEDDGEWEGDDPDEEEGIIYVK